MAWNMGYPVKQSGYGGAEREEDGHFIVHRGEDRRLCKSRTHAAVWIVGPGSLLRAGAWACWVAISIVAPVCCPAEWCFWATYCIYAWS